MKQFSLYLAIVLSCFSIAQAQNNEVSQAQAMLQQGKYSGVVSLLSPVVKEQPKLAEVHYLLAEAYRQLPQPNIFQANQHIVEALNLQPKNERYWESKVRLLATNDPYFGATISRQERVSEVTRELISQNPNNVLANEIRGTYAFESVMEDAHAV
jgi:Flp pilus assembly protein TadD